MATWWNSTADEMIVRAAPADRAGVELRPGRPGTGRGPDPRGRVRRAGAPEPAVRRRLAGRAGAGGRPAGSGRRPEPGRLGPRLVGPGPAGRREGRRGEAGLLVGPGAGLPGRARRRRASPASSRSTRGGRFGLPWKEPSARSSPTWPTAREWGVDDWGELIPEFAVAGWSRPGCWSGAATRGRSRFLERAVELVEAAGAVGLLAGRRTGRPGPRRWPWLGRIRGGRPSAYREADRPAAAGRGARRGGPGSFNLADLSAGSATTPGRARGPAGGDGHRPGRRGHRRGDPALQQRTGGRPGGADRRARRRDPADRRSESEETTPWPRSTITARDEPRPAPRELPALLACRARRLGTRPRGRAALLGAGGCLALLAAWSSGRRWRTSSSSGRPTRITATASWSR